MTSKQKFVSIVLIGWLVPATLLFVQGNALPLGGVAVAIAWWHGYMAAKLEAKADSDAKCRSEVGQASA